MGKVLPLTGRKNIDSSERPSDIGIGAVAPARSRATIAHQIGQGRFAFVLQPIVHATTKAVLMQEALLRYRAKDGLIWPASSVVPQAEQSGAIDLIDCLALETAARYLWDHRTAQLSINLSRKSLGSAKWFRTLDELVEIFPGITQRLTLEITETAATEPNVSLAGFVIEARRRGVRVAIDDFGAGVTTWADVDGSDISFIKLDRHLVNDHSRCAAVVDTLLTLSEDRPLKLVAEGIEDRASAARVTALGVHYLQGYLFGAPRALTT